MQNFLETLDNTAQGIAVAKKMEGNSNFQFWKNNWNGMEGNSNVAIVQ